MRKSVPAALYMSVFLGLTACAYANVGQLQMQFEQGLSAQASATEALRSWCDRRGLAKQAQISAELVRGSDMPPPNGIRGFLGVSASEPLTYRHVKLMCGGLELSQAHNWFVPSRLSTDMNRQLAETDTPFGMAVSSLNFSRHAIASTRQRDAACPAGTILANRALLKLPDGRGLAMVIECYTAVNLR